MMRSLKKFFADQTGAVTVDFVVLTGAIVLLAVASFIPIRTAVTESKDALAITIADATTSP